MKPKRIQLSRKKGWRMPPNTRKVDRTTRRGNPYRPGIYYAGLLVLDAKMAVELFLHYAKSRARSHPDWIAPLRGKNLACWCRLCEKHKDGKPLGEHCPDCEPCHADVLLEIANASCGKGK